VICSFQAVGLHCDIEGSEEYDVVPNACLEDDASFVQLNAAKMSSRDVFKEVLVEDDASFVQLNTAKMSSREVFKDVLVRAAEMSNMSVAKVNQSGSSNPVGAERVSVSPIDLAPPHVGYHDNDLLLAGLHSRYSGRYTALVAEMASSWSHLRLRSSNSLVIALMVSVFVILLLYFIVKTARASMRAPSDVGNDLTLQSRRDLTSFSTLKGSAQRSPGSVSTPTPECLNTPPQSSLPSAPASSHLLSSSAQRQQPQEARRLAPVLSPGPTPPKFGRQALKDPMTLTSSGESMGRADAGAGPIPSSSPKPSSVVPGSVVLKVPILYIDEDEIPSSGQTLKVLDGGGAERYVVKVWPKSFNTQIAAHHPDAHEFLQICSSRGGALQEVFLCAVCGSGNKFSCHVYVEGNRTYGLIAEDMTFPTKEYVVGSTYTLWSAPDKGRLLTILRRKGQGIHILKPPHIIADVTEHLDEDSYEAVCQPGVDVNQIVLMILGMDRLVDHTARHPAS